MALTPVSRPRQHRAMRIGMVLIATAGLITAAQVGSVGAVEAPVDAAGTTSPICAGHPCTAHPPEAFIAGEAGEVRTAPGSYCWASPTEPSTVCGDVVIDDPSKLPSLSIRRGETLTLRFGTEMAPTSVLLQERDTVSKALPATNPVQFTADLSPGNHLVSFFTRWLQGDASYHVVLNVARPADTASHMLLLAMHSGKAMDVPASTHAPGAQLVQWRAHGDLNQQWRLMPFGIHSNIYVIVSAESGLALDVTGGSLAPGAPVIQWPWHGGVNQLWVVVPFSDLVPAGAPDVYVVVSALTSQALDVDRASTADGAPLIQWPWHGGLNQIWLGRTTTQP